MLAVLTKQAFASCASRCYHSISYEVLGKIAHIQLNRPERMNAIDLHMPGEIQNAVEKAANDASVKVILVDGKGVFCSGYDLKLFAESPRGSQPGSQNMPWDPMIDYQCMSRNTSFFMSIWRCPKPVVAKIRGVAIGGGSDLALCCDVTFAEEEARIGYPPARVWGCPTTAMWVYRLGLEKAKRFLFTGDLLTGREAADLGLIGEALPADDLDEAVDNFLRRVTSIPSNQLFFQKECLNQAIESMGLLSTQRLATFFDGMSRHTPEGVAFQERAQQVGFKRAIQERDSSQEAAWSQMHTKNDADK